MSEPNPSNRISRRKFLYLAGLGGLGAALSACVKAIVPATPTIAAAPVPPVQPSSSPQPSSTPTETATAAPTAAPTKDSSQPKEQVLPSFTLPTYINGLVSIGGAHPPPTPAAGEDRTIPNAYVPYYASDPIAYSATVIGMSKDAYIKNFDRNPYLAIALLAASTLATAPNTAQGDSFTVRFPDYPALDGLRIFKTKLDDGVFRGGETQIKSVDGNTFNIKKETDLIVIGKNGDEYSIAYTDYPRRGGTPDLFTVVVSGATLAGLLQNKAGVTFDPDRLTFLFEGIKTTWNINQITPDLMEIVKRESVPKIPLKSDAAVFETAAALPNLQTGALKTGGKVIPVGTFGSFVSVTYVDEAGDAKDGFIVKDALTQVPRNLKELSKEKVPFIRQSCLGDLYADTGPWQNGQAPEADKYPGYMTTGSTYQTTGKDQTESRIGFRLKFNSKSTAGSGIYFAGRLDPSSLDNSTMLIVGINKRGDIEFCLRDGKVTSGADLIYFSPTISTKITSRFIKGNEEISILFDGSGKTLNVLNDKGIVVFTKNLAGSSPNLSNGLFPDSRVTTGAMTWNGSLLYADFLDILTPPTGKLVPEATDFHLPDTPAGGYDDAEMAKHSIAPAHWPGFRPDPHNQATIENFISGTLVNYGVDAGGVPFIDIKVGSNIIHEAIPETPFGVSAVRGGIVPVYTATRKSAGRAEEFKAIMDKYFRIGDPISLDHFFSGWNNDGRRVTVRTRR